MKYLIFFVLLMSSCAQEWNVPQTSFCVAEQTDSGVVVKCSNGTQATVSNGKDGKNGADGKDGAQGQQGIQGNQGLQGIQGVSGSSVTTVKFCDDYVPVYPSSFPEYGLCIDNKLYGVYYSSSLGVFLAYLPPGRYQSTNNSEACIFTVTLGCEITP